MSVWHLNLTVQSRTLDFPPSPFPAIPLLSLGLAFLGHYHLLRGSIKNLVLTPILYLTNPSAHLVGSIIHIYLGTHHFCRASKLVFLHFGLPCPFTNLVMSWMPITSLISTGPALVQATSAYLDFWNTLWALLWSHSRSLPFYSPPSCQNDHLTMEIWLYLIMLLLKAFHGLFTRPTARHKLLVSLWDSAWYGLAPHLLPSFPTLPIPIAASCLPSCLTAHTAPRQACSCSKKPLYPSCRELPSSTSSPASSFPSIKCQFKYPLFTRAFQNSLY